MQALRSYWRPRSLGFAVVFWPVLLMIIVAVAAWLPLPIWARAATMAGGLGGMVTWSVLASVRFRRSANEIAQVLNQAVYGDVRVRVKYRGQDEMGQLSWAVNRVLRSWNDTLYNIMESTSQVAATIGEISAAAQQASQAVSEVARITQEVASRAERESETVEQIAETIKEMTIQMDNIAASASDMDTSARETSIASDSGQKAAQEASQRIQTIEESVLVLSQALDELGQDSLRIGEITEVITSIADQTNLLSLNAAIEAARAGDQGRGFAVVAEEVRKLAEQSAHSAESIGHLIRAIQAKTERSIDLMKKSREEVKLGVQAVQQTQAVFQSIAQSFQAIVERSQKVAEATAIMVDRSQSLRVAIKELAAGAHENSNGAQQVAASTEEQNASLEEISAAVSGLNSVANQLKGMFQVFKVSPPKSKDQ